MDIPPPVSHVFVDFENVQLAHLKFEVLFDIVGGERLQASTVTFDGITRRVDD